MFKKIIIALFIFNFNCDNKSSDFPDWYLNSPKDSKYLYSVGSGSVKEEFAPSKSELFMLAAQKLPKKLMRKISEHYSN